MLEEIAKKASESMWRKIGEKALSTAVTTFITETIKASVEVVKKAKLREQKAEFEERNKKPSSEAPDDEIEETEDDAADAADSNESEPTEPPTDGGPSVDFASYVARKRL